MLHWTENLNGREAVFKDETEHQNSDACPQTSSVHHKLRGLHIVNAIGIYMDTRFPTERRRDKVANTGTQTVLKLWQFLLQAFQLLHLEYIWLFRHPIVYPMVKQKK